MRKCWPCAGTVISLVFACEADARCCGLQRKKPRRETGQFGIRGTEGTIGPTHSRSSANASELGRRCFRFTTLLKERSSCPCSSSPLPPSPPAEQATASEDQARNTRTDHRAWYKGHLHVDCGIDGARPKKSKPGASRREGVLFSQCAGTSKTKGATRGTSLLCGANGIERSGT